MLPIAVGGSRPPWKDLPVRTLMSPFDIRGAQ
jgi:hypothetical protein